MNVNLVDALVVGGAVYGALRGWGRGLSRELPGLIGVAVWLVTGCGLYHWTERGVSKLSTLSGKSYGLLGLPVAWAVAVLIVRRFRRQVHEQARKKVPDERKQQVGGMMAGGLKVLLFGCILILIVGHLPGFLGKPFNHGSLVGRTLRRAIAAPLPR